MSRHTHIPLENRADIVRFFAKTDVGKVREGNEDNFMVVNVTSEAAEELSRVIECELSDHGLTIMVSDGMGGAAAGEVASELAVDTVMREMHFDSRVPEAQFVGQLEHSLQTANEVISRHAVENPSMRGMGATATAAGIYKDHVYVAQIGDSRAYLIRDNEIRQLTRDQSFVNQLVEAGKITEEEAEIHPRRNVILQALGNQSNLQVVMTKFTAKAGDYLLLCSDGLTGQVRREQILQTVLTVPEMEAATRQLVAQANASGGTDNITVVLACFGQSENPQEWPEVEDEETIPGELAQDTDNTLPSLPVDPPPASARPRKSNRLLYSVTAILLLVLFGAGVIWVAPQLRTPISRGEALGTLETTRLDYEEYLEKNLEMISTLHPSQKLLADTVRINRWLDSADVAFRTERFEKVLDLCAYARADLQAWKATANAYLSRAVYDGFAIKQLVLNRVFASERGSSPSQAAYATAEYPTREELAEMPLAEMMLTSTSMLEQRVDHCSNNARRVIELMSLQDSTAAARIQKTQIDALASFELARYRLLATPITLSEALGAMRMADSSLSVLCSLEDYVPASLKEFQPQDLPTTNNQMISPGSIAGEIPAALSEPVDATIQTSKIDADSIAPNE